MILFKYIWKTHFNKIKFCHHSGVYRENQGSPSCRRHTPSARAGWCTPAPHFQLRWTSSSHFSNFQITKHVLPNWLSLIYIQYLISDGCQTFDAAKLYFTNLFFFWGCCSCRSSVLVSKFTFRFASGNLEAFWKLGFLELNINRYSFYFWHWSAKFDSRRKKHYLWKGVRVVL